MRTTLTLEPAVAERINRIVRSRRRSMKDVVNEALREGLKAIEASSPGAPSHFVVEAHDFGVRPGIDLDTIGRLADELEDETIAARFRHSERA
jgi:hypothetical protein